MLLPFLEDFKKNCKSNIIGSTSLYKRKQRTRRIKQQIEHQNEKKLSIPTIIRTSNQRWGKIWRSRLPLPTYQSTFGQL